MTDKKRPLVFGYVRVSTENQLENYSIDEQVQRIQSYCLAKDWVLLKTYTDGGFSGGNTDRPALQQLLAAVRQQPIDAVVVYKLDRLSRSQKDTLTLIEDEFLAHNTDFVSINENFDTSSPFGRAMIGILSVFAQLEKDQIVERFTMGRIARCKAGYYHGGGIVPLGYQYKDGMLVVDEYHASMVREIFSSFLAGKSINAIWHEMAAKYQGKWSAAKIQTILKNSVYIGKVKFAGAEYDGVHQPLITEEDYRTANDLLVSSDRKKSLNFAQKTPFRADTLLSGLLRCARCGARYAGAHGYYKCYSRSKTSRQQIKDPNCKNDNWVIEELNQVVVNSIYKLVEHPDASEQLILTSAIDKPPAPDIKAIQRRLKELDMQIDNLLDLYQISAIPIDTLNSRVNALEAERKVLTVQMETESKRHITPETAFLESIKRFSEDFKDSPLETRRLLVNSLVKQILLDGKNVKIEWRL